MKLITSLSDSHVSWACLEDHNKRLWKEENKKVDVGGDVGAGLIVALRLQNTFHIFGSIPIGHMHTKDVQCAFWVFSGTSDESHWQYTVSQEKGGTTIVFCSLMCINIMQRHFATILFTFLTLIYLCPDCMHFFLEYRPPEHTKNFFAHVVPRTFQNHIMCNLFLCNHIILYRVIFKWRCFHISTDRNIISDSDFFFL